MTSNRIISGIVIIALTALTSCDYVDNPTPNTTSVSTECDTIFEVTMTPSMQKHVLIEDFSGHKCSNCPDAQQESENIHNSVGDRAITVTIHPDPNIATQLASFTKESPPGSGSYETVWYIPEGGEIVDFFGIPSYLPIGMIDRVMNTSDRYFDYQSWSAAVNTRLSEPLDVTIAGHAELLPDGTTVCGQTEVEFINPVSASTEIRIVHYLVEDSIPDWQLDGTTNVPDYMHHHILRAVSGGNIWGEVVATGNISVGTKSQHFISFDNYTKTSDDHLYIIAYVYDDATKEILQTEQWYVE